MEALSQHTPGDAGAGITLGLLEEMQGFTQRDTILVEADHTCGIH